VLAAGAGFLFVDEAGSVRELAQPEDGRTYVRMNDGACDPQGRFWAGTMAYDESPGAGALYRLELDGGCTTVLTGLPISNGIGWSPDASTMYLNDSGTGCVDAFRFDGPSGDISDRRTLVHIDRPGVVPDGITVDEESGIWIALWNGAAVHRYAPDGSLLASVQLPVQRPTSCAFGGPGRDTLFITTADRPRQRRASPPAPRRQGIRHRRARYPRPPLPALPRPDTTAVRSLSPRSQQQNVIIDVYPQSQAANAAHGAAGPASAPRLRLWAHLTHPGPQHPETRIRSPTGIGHAIARPPLRSAASGPSSTPARSSSPSDLAPRAGAHVIGRFVLHTRLRPQHSQAYRVDRAFTLRDLDHTASRSVTVATVQDPPYLVGS
jgi:hypothetical protein